MVMDSHSCFMTKGKVKTQPQFPPEKKVVDSSEHSRVSHNLSTNREEMFPLFFPPEQMKIVPRLDLQGRRGSTDYIDFLQCSELTEPVMKGEDLFGRLFLAFLHARGVMVWFQRYSPEWDYWTHAGRLPQGVSVSGGCASDRFGSDQRTVWARAALARFYGKKIKQEITQWLPLSLPTALLGLVCSFFG